MMANFKKVTIFFDFNQIRFILILVTVDQACLPSLICDNTSQFF